MASGSSAAASTVAALRQRFKEYDVDRGATRLSNAVVRGAAIGVAGRGGFYLLSALARRLLRSKPSAGRRTSTAQIFKNVGRYAAMIGSFGGIYVAADELIAILVGEERCAGRARVCPRQSALGSTLERFRVASGRRGERSTETAAGWRSPRAARSVRAGSPGSLGLSRPGPPFPRARARAQGREERKRAARGGGA